MAHRETQDLGEIYRTRYNAAVKTHEAHLAALDYDLTIQGFVHNALKYCWLLIWGTLRWIALYIVLPIAVIWVAQHYLRNDGREGEGYEHRPIQGQEGQWYANRAAPLVDTLAAILVWVLWPFRVLNVAMRQTYIYTVNATARIRRAYNEPEWWEWLWLHYQYITNWVSRNAIYIFFGLCGLHMARSLGMVFMKEAGIGPWSGQPRYYRPPITHVYSQAREEMHWYSHPEPPDMFPKKVEPIGEIWEEARYPPSAPEPAPQQYAETSVTERSISKSAAPSESPKPGFPKRTASFGEDRSADASLSESTQSPTYSHDEDWSQATAGHDAWNIYEPVSNIASSLLAKQEKPRLGHRHEPPTDKRTHVGGKMVWCSSCQQWHCCELPY